MEQRKLTTVKNDYVEHLVKVALRVDPFDETVRCKATNTEASTLKGGGSSQMSDSQVKERIKFLVVNEFKKSFQIIAT